MFPTPYTSFSKFYLHIEQTMLVNLQRLQGKKPFLLFMFCELANFLVFLQQIVNALVFEI